jgi:hypothetical protein
LNDPNRLTGLVGKTFMKEGGDSDVPRTQRHVTDFWNSAHDNLHILWPVVCRWILSLFNRRVNHEECKVVDVSRVGEIKTAYRKPRVEIF